MSNTVKVIQWIIIGVLLGAVSFLYVGKCSTDKENEKLLKALQYISNLPPDTIVQVDTVTHIDKVYIKPKPIPNDTGFQGVADFGCDSIATTYYSETYKKNGVSIDWEAISACENDSSKISFIRFNKVIYPSKTRTIKKTIHDTIPKEVPAKLTNRFFLYGGAHTNFNSSFGAELGAGYLYKQNWGVMVGPMYNENKLYLSGKIFVTL